jgi:alpha-1,6-mannosyltransferase
LHPEKNVACLIDAVMIVNEEQPTGMIIVGDGPYRQKLERKIAGTKNIICTGQINDPEILTSYLGSADAFIHVCASETFGLAVSEALCCGTPIIVPDRGGAFAAARPEYAEVFRTADVSDCAQAIRRMLDRDRNQLSAAARTAAEIIPTMEEHFQQLFAHYLELQCSPHFFLLPPAREGGGRATDG